MAATLRKTGQILGQIMQRRRSSAGSGFKMALIANKIAEPFEKWAGI
ncbi:hypothetical protein BCO26_0627 [Heyndrickxia coagulans 2-6]|nr:hypothetical protein BCO26_0627 [Heyndrickxia coagulans 2-6]